MRKVFSALLILVLVCGVATWKLFLENSSDDLGIEKKQESRPVSQVVISLSDDHIDNVKSTSFEEKSNDVRHTPQLIKSQPQRSVSQVALSLEDYRAELGHNPHATTSIGMRTFAIQMASRMEVGLDSDTEARKLFPELVACASGLEKALPRSIKAACAENALRLSEKFSVLQSAAKQMRAKLPKEVATLLTR